MAYMAARDRCSEVLKQEYDTYIRKIKKKLQGLPSSSKSWWKLVKNLSCATASTSSIPPLQSSDGAWHVEAPPKAELLASTFESKYKLPERELNEFTDILEASSSSCGFLPLRRRRCLQLLKALHETSSTGPDELGVIILKNARMHWQRLLLYLLGVS